MVTVRKAGEKIEKARHYRKWMHDKMNMYPNISQKEIAKMTEEYSKLAYEATLERLEEEKGKDRKCGK